jgi:hypothetical protein
MEALRIQMGTIEYRVRPGVNGDIYILFPLKAPEPKPGKFVYNLDDNVVVLPNAIRQSAGKITGFIGEKPYPNVCYPKMAPPEEHGVWLKGVFTDKQIPGYGVWVIYVGKAKHALTLGIPDLAKINAGLERIRAK